jgi:hemerythrin
MSFKLDYEEPLPQVVKRLRNEHSELRSKLERIIEEAKTGNPAVAISLLNLVKPLILRHAVEEEARLARSIMQECRDESGQSIEILQQHRRIEEFLQDKLPYLGDLPKAKATKEIEEFVSELEKHHSEEEVLTFPLALKSDALAAQKRKANWFCVFV